MSFAAMTLPADALLAQSGSLTQHLSVDRARTLTLCGVIVTRAWRLYLPPQSLAGEVICQRCWRRLEASPDQRPARRGQGGWAGVLLSLLLGAGSLFVLGLGLRDQPGSGAGPAPSLPSAAVPGPSWGSAECTWVRLALERDRGLDLAEVAALESGADTRYPVSDVPVYQEWARRWGVALGQVGEICAVPLRLPASADLDQMQAWFRAAAQAHLADAQAYPANADWDQQWVAVYRRLVADYLVLYR